MAGSPQHMQAYCQLLRAQKIPPVPQLIKGRGVKTCKECAEEGTHTQEFELIVESLKFPGIF